MDIYAVVENGVTTNIAIWNEEAVWDFAGIVVNVTNHTPGVEIGDLYDGQYFTKPPYTPSVDAEPTIRSSVVDVYADYQVQQQDRAILVHTEGVTVTLPPYTPYQEGKIYTVTRRVAGGSIFVRPAEGEVIYVKGIVQQEDVELTEMNISRDFQRHKPSNSAPEWDTQ